VGAWLVDRFASGRRAFNRTPNIFRFALFAAMAGTTVSATIGVTSLILGRIALRPDFSSIWMTWWLGDAAGALIFAPAILLWAQDPIVRWSRNQAIEALALLVGLLIAAQAVFGGVLPGNSSHYPVDFLCIPIFAWAAFRFGRRGAAIAILLVSAVAIRGTLQGHGPFAAFGVNPALLLLQAFLAVTALTTQILATEVAERRLVEDRLRQLAKTDPLTGLTNYRQLASVLDAEIRRTGRSKRPFAVLFFDLDGLKGINDRHGHLVGSRALIRMAEAIRASCRALDTAARYGGDEFAVVLPEASEEAGRQVAHRVCERLASDGQSPPITASVGIAVYPRDGETQEALLGAADRLLYRAKADGSRGVAPSPRRAGRRRRA
jgi:diguanylate cyclase (GGDEF)-like protein